MRIPVAVVRIPVAVVHILVAVVHILVARTVPLGNEEMERQLWMTLRSLRSLI